MQLKKFPIPKCTDAILNERYTVQVGNKAVTVALNVMMLGEVREANRIVDVMDYRSALLNFEIQP